MATMRTTCPRPIFFHEILQVIHSLGPVSRRCELRSALNSIVFRGYQQSPLDGIMLFVSITIKQNSPVCRNAELRVQSSMQDCAYCPPNLSRLEAVGPPIFYNYTAPSVPPEAKMVPQTTTSRGFKSFVPHTQMVLSFSPSMSCCHLEPFGNEFPYLHCAFCR
jgi:hypothetical protein